MGPRVLPTLVDVINHNELVVFEPTHLKKYAPQIGPFPQVGVKINIAWNHHLDEYVLPITNASAINSTFVSHFSCSGCVAPDKGPKIV